MKSRLLLGFALACGVSTSPSGALAWDEPLVTPDAVLEETDRLAEAIPEEKRFRSTGIVADRRDRSVILFARATGLAETSIAEFILVGPESAHDYEAIARTYAQPSDICRAIEFIGVPRGEPAFARPMAFWPLGERVMVSFTLFDSPDFGWHPLESLIYDKRREGALPPRGLVYAGSRWSEDGQCAADTASPGSVVSTYNEPTTVFDLPHMATQGEVYERFVVNPDLKLAEEAILRIRLVPEPRPGGIPRVARYTFRLTRRETDAPGGFGVELSAQDQTPAALPDPTLEAALRYLRVRVERDEVDPYLCVSFDDSLTVEQAHAAARALQAFEGPEGLRVDAPAEGQLYYRAFNPPEAWRSREERTAQPWEVHVRRDGNGTDARPEAAAGYKFFLVQIREHWLDDRIHPELEIIEHPLDGPHELPGRLRELGGGMPVILVFAEPDTPLAAFMPALRLVQPTHPTIHVFPGWPKKASD